MSPTSTSLEDPKHVFEVHTDETQFYVGEHCSEKDRQSGGSGEENGCGVECAQRMAKAIRRAWLPVTSEPSDATVTGLVCDGCVQCCCPQGKLLSLRILEDQFASPCPCPWTTKSSKIIKHFAFCKQYVVYDHVKSINSVTVTVHEVTVKNGLLTYVRYCLLILYEYLYFAEIGSTNTTDILQYYTKHKMQIRNIRST